jgi:tRNA-specific 2-thiouridylase
VEDFTREYAAGRTPNPCLRCNEKIKFEAVLERGVALGFEAVATGHYARLEDGADGQVQLHRAVDPGKDQSYVLAVLNQRQLRHSMFPLGVSTKDDVRREADRRGLAVAAKPDSHDICFIADGDTATWLRDRLGPDPGDIVDVSGEVLGQHGGTFGFTVGQRRGLRLDRPAPDGRPRYVLDIEPVSRTVTVGGVEDLVVDSITARQPRWCESGVEGSMDCTVQLRAHGDEHRAVARAGSDGVEIDLREPARGIAPGQAAVIYAGTRVVGSATIATARRRAAV